MRLADDVPGVLAANDQGVETAIAAPGAGEGYWAGGPSVVWQDGEFWLAYRVRRPVDYVPVEQARGFVDGSHELRTAYVPRLDSLSQSD